MIAFVLASSRLHDTTVLGDAPGRENVPHVSVVMNLRSKQRWKT